MIPLEVTHEVRAREAIFNFLQASSEVPFAKAIFNMLTAFKDMYFKYENFDFPPIHDACVINYILHPNDFELKKVTLFLFSLKLSLTLEKYLMAGLTVTSPILKMDSRKLILLIELLLR